MMSVDVEQIAIDQAAQVTGLDAALLRHLVVCGVLAGVVGATGGMCDLDQAAQIAEQLQAAREPVEGVGILAPEAAAKYGFSDQSIYNWHTDGWIKALSEKGRNRPFNEADIAFARVLANLVGQVPGRSVFPAKPRSGRPRKQR
jgi:hypothetical protein